LIPVEIRDLVLFHSFGIGCGLNSACFMNMWSLMPAKKWSQFTLYLSSSCHLVQERVRGRIYPPYQTPSSCGLLIKLLVFILSRIYSEIVLGLNLSADWEQIQVLAAPRDTNFGHFDYYVIIPVNLEKGVTSVMICALNIRLLGCYCSVRFSDNSTKAGQNHVLVTVQTVQNVQTVQTIVY